MFSKKDSLKTYADREQWAHFIHAVTVSSCTYILDLFRVPRQFQLLVHELGKGLHPVGTATHTHKLLEKEMKESELGCVASENGGFSLPKTTILQTLMSPNISGRL